MSLRLALVVLAVALAAWLATVGRAWDGWTGMNHTAGTVAALADAAAHGEAPGREREGALLATVYAPPFPLVVAGLHGLGASWHGSLRWASLLSALALLGAAFAATVAAGGSAAGAAVALALLMASFPFTAASLAGRADLLAAALSVAAFAAWNADREQRGWLTASLAALAWLTKVSTLTVPLAMVVWAFNQQQAVPAVRFMARFVAAAVVGLLLTLPFGGPGWYADVLSGLVTAPLNTSHPLRGPAELLRYAGSFAELAAAAALALAFLSSRETRHRPVRSFGFAALLVALVVLANRGSDHNHLLELTALAAVCAGVWCERSGVRAAALPSALVAVVVLAASWRDLQSNGREAARPESRRAAVLAVVRAEPGPVLTEDALLSLAADHRPVVADPASLRARAAIRDAEALAVVRGLEAGRYGLVVLQQELEAGAARWYRDFHLGPEAVAAVRAHYVRTGTADGWSLYRPAPPAGATADGVAPDGASAPTVEPARP